MDASLSVLYPTITHETTAAQYNYSNWRLTYMLSLFTKFHSGAINVGYV